jgi:uncharacterized membrane protein YqgA involved in biofilm formation
MDDLVKKNTNKYESIGGWLLLLCISLTILSPLRTIYTNSLNIMIISSFLDEFDKGDQYLILFETILGIGITIYSIVAGVHLWKIKPNAVKFAKTFFLVFLGYIILIAIFSTIVKIESNYIKNTIGNILYFTIWYLYLDKSERVKKTYSININY